MKIILFLGGIRGFASLAVVCFHAGLLFNGMTAVDLFFTLSAFLLTAAMYEKFQLYAKQQRSLKDWGLLLITYFIKRVFRIYPLLIALAIALYFAGAPFRAETYGIPLDEHYSMWKVLTFETPCFAMWTIPVEFQYYLCIPVVVAVYMILRTKFLQWPFLAYIFYQTFMQGFFEEPRFALEPLVKHIWVFLSGSATGLLYIDLLPYQNTNLHPFAKFCLEKFTFLVTVYLFLIFTNTFLFARLFWAEIPTMPAYAYSSGPICFLILKESLFPGQLATNFEAGFLQFLGDISFSMYLLHTIPMRFKFLPAEFTFHSFVLFFTILISTCTYYGIELPMMKVGNRLCHYIDKKYQDGPNAKGKGFLGHFFHYTAVDSSTKDEAAYEVKVE
jgi:peptidoglycan/LPS O-acetylase OafA/YrhL